MVYEIKSARGGTVLEQVDHTWDLGGNLTKRENQLLSDPAKTENFTYDYADRLKSASTAYTACYEYSAIGCITSIGTTSCNNSYTYGSSSPAHPHAVTSYNGTTDAYEANGNMTTCGSQTLTWDEENRVIGVTGGARFT